MITPWPTLPLRTTPLPGESVDSWIEALALRYKLSPRRLLPSLGLSGRAMSTNHLIRATPPGTWRRVELAAGLREECLDSVVGGSFALFPSMVGGGSRFCPACLADSDRWPLAWRSNWTVACSRHGLLLHDYCPGCRNPPRTTIAGGRTPVPSATCIFQSQAGAERCGTELATVPTVAAHPAVLAVQHWVDQLTAGLEGPDPAHSVAVLSDLPTVVCWLLGRQDVNWQAEADALAPGRRPCPTQPFHGRLPRTDAALTAAVLDHAMTIYGTDERRAVTLIRGLLPPAQSRMGVLPPNMGAQRWQALSPTFPNRFLRAVDKDLAAIDRLRLKTSSPSAGRPTGSATARVRIVPQLIWPDWAARLLPVTRFNPELFRATASTCLLAPGTPERKYDALTTHLNPRVSATQVSVLLHAFGDLPDPCLSDALTAFCRIADYLDRAGSPIDYQRRRETLPAESVISWERWRDLACSAGAHPGDRPKAGHRNQGRYLHAQRHLLQLLSGADLADRRHRLAFDNPNDRNRYVGFSTSMTPALRTALNEHGAKILADLGIDEPLTWSPPPHLAQGLALPGVDTRTLDLDCQSPGIVEAFLMRPDRLGGGWRVLL